jgi:hypothetical protein
MMNRRTIIIAVAVGIAGFALGESRYAFEGTSYAQAAGPAHVIVDDANAALSYANFCRVTGTPEEVILDYGLNPQPFGDATIPIKVNQRIVVSFYSAKRMLQALDATIQRHEKVFGEIETDVQKRAKPRSDDQSAPRQR